MSSLLERGLIVTIRGVICQGATSPPAADRQAIGIGGYVFQASRRDSRPATGGGVSLDTGIAIRGLVRAAAGAGLAAKYGAGSDPAKA